MHYLERRHHARALARLHEAESVCYQRKGVREHLLLAGIILCYLRCLPRAPTDLYSLERADITGS